MRSSRFECFTSSICSGIEILGHLAGVVHVGLLCMLVSVIKGKVDNRFADELRGATWPNFGVERCRDATVLRSKIEVSKHESKPVQEVQGLGLNQAVE